MKKRRPSFHNEGRLTKNFFLIPHGVREFYVLVDLRCLIKCRSTGSGNNIKRLHNTVGGKQRHLRIRNNISLFHNCQNLKDMKKNYIAPNTEMINLASQGIMQSLNVMTGSGAPTIDSGAAID